MSSASCTRGWTSSATFLKPLQALVLPAPSFLALVVHPLELEREPVACRPFRVKARTLVARDGGLKLPH